MSTLTRHHTHSVTFAAAPAQVRVARSWAASVSGLHGEAADDLSLIVSELATNACAHSRSGLADGAYTLTVTRHHNRVRVGVLDSGPLTSTIPRLRPAADDAEAGRGLAIVATLAQRWGTEHHHGRTRVWADVATPPLAPCPR